MFSTSSVFQAINRISRKAAYRLGKNHVDLTSPAVLDHTVKLVTLLCVSASDAVIGINLNKLPLWIALNVSSVMFNLNIVARFLFFKFSGYSAVSSNSYFLNLGYPLLRSNCALGWDYRNVLCSFSASSDEP